MWNFIFGILLLFFNFRSSDATYRLPNNTKPEAYHIMLNFGDFSDLNQKFVKFNGDIFIKFRVKEENVNHFTIHSSVNIENQGNIILCKNMTTICLNRIPIEVFPEPDKEFLIISTVNKTLTKNSVYYLYIQYTGRIYDTITGVYRGSYSTKDDSM